MEKAENALLIEAFYMNAEAKVFQITKANGPNPKKSELIHAGVVAVNGLFLILGEQTGN